MSPNQSITKRRSLVLVLVMVLTTGLGLAVSPGTASAAGFSSFDAGVFNPGQVKHYWWNNANSDAYAPGLETTGVDQPNSFCDVEVTRTWYQRHSSGEREFHLELTSNGVQRCRVTVWLARLDMFRESATGELNPGQSRAGRWNNAHTEKYVYAVGVLPASVSSGTCAIEVSTTYRTQPGGENEFIYRATNVGTVACSAQLRHISLPVGNTFNLSGTPFPPGNVGVWPHLLSTSLRVVVPGAVPDTQASAACQFGVGPLSYFGPGSVHVDLVNSGTVACGLKATFAIL